MGPPPNQKRSSNLAAALLSATAKEGTTEFPNFAKDKSK